MKLSGAMAKFAAYDDEFSDLTGPMLVTNDEEFELPKVELTLAQINAEIQGILDLLNRGLPYDDARLDLLLKEQRANPEYQALQAYEREQWLDSIEEFICQCLERTRTFIPVDVYEASLDSMQALGLSLDIAKRIMQKQCLWLVRMSSAEISRLHEADLYGRYNTAGQNLDVIELAAIYASLPDAFSNDTSGRKAEWRAAMEESLKQMLEDNDNDCLPVGKVRSPVYDGLQYGPVRDTVTVREYRVIARADDGTGRRKSFTETCRQANILSRLNS